MTKKKGKGGKNKKGRSQSPKRESKSKSKKNNAAKQAGESTTEAVGVEEAATMKATKEEPATARKESAAVDNEESAEPTSTSVTTGTSEEDDPPPTNKGDDDKSLTGNTADDDDDDDDGFQDMDARFHASLTDLLGSSDVVSTTRTKDNIDDSDVVSTTRTTNNNDDDSNNNNNNNNDDGLEMEEEEEEEKATKTETKTSTSTRTSTRTRTSVSSCLEDRVREMITSHDEAWLLLATRLAIPRLKAIEITTQTSMELILMAKSLEEEMLQDSDSKEKKNSQELEDKLIDAFRTKCILDTSDNGSIELFQRSMFSTVIDYQHKGLVGREGIMQWLNHTYSITPAMRGGRELPPRVVLQTKLLHKLNSTEAKKKGGLSFEDIQTIVKGAEIRHAANRIASSTTTTTSTKLEPIFPEQEKKTRRGEGDVCIDFCAYLDRKIWSYVKGGSNLFKSRNRKESNQLFQELDTDNSNSASRDEIHQFVSSNSQLWAMLSINLGHPEWFCQEVATRVAMELAHSSSEEDDGIQQQQLLRGQAAMEAELTKEQFHQFRKKYILDPKGSQEFFHRAVFASFDLDQNGVLDEEELDSLLDTFYKGGSIFQGDGRLPPKEQLQQQILKQYDINNHRGLSFDQIRGVISGKQLAVV